MFYSTKRIDLLISFRSAMWLRVAQSTGLPFLFVPVTLASYVGLPGEKANNVAGLVNFMRNMGSSVGTSMVTTMLARRGQFHQLRLAFHTTGYDVAFQNQVAGLARQLISSGVSPADAPQVAYGVIYRSLQQQAQTLAFIDTYWLLAIAASIMFVLSFFLRKNDPRGGGAVAAH